MQKRTGERHASIMDAASEILRVYCHEILNIKPFLDRLIPYLSPYGFLSLVLEQNGGVKSGRFTSIGVFH